MTEQTPPDHRYDLIGHTHKRQRLTPKLEANITVYLTLKDKRLRLTNLWPYSFLYLYPLITQTSLYHSPVLFTHAPCLPCTLLLWERRGLCAGRAWI